MDTKPKPHLNTLPISVYLQSGIIFVGMDKWFTLPIEMEREIVLPIHGDSFLERANALDYFSCSVHGFCGSFL